MKKKLTAAIIIAAATTLTACGSNSDGEFTDEQLENARSTMNEFDEADRRKEETLYPHVRAQLQESGSTVQLDDALEICEQLRSGMTTDDIIDEVDPYSPGGYRKVISVVATGMCQF